MENFNTQYTADKIRSLRKSRYMTQQDLAKALNVRQASVSSWETGKVFPHSTIFVKLSNLFKVDIDELTGATEKGIIDLKGLLSSPNILSFGETQLSSEQRKRALIVLSGLLDDV